MTVDPQDPNRLSCATIQGKLITSGDAGETWEELGVSLPQGRARTIICAP